MSKFKVIVVSVSPSGKGGVATVINTFKKSKLLNENCSVRYFSSHSSVSSLNKIYTILWAYLQFPFVLLFGKYELIHIHGSLKTSFYRKLYFLLVGKLFGLPVIYHLHTAQIDKYFTGITLLKFKLTKYIFSLYSKRLCLGFPVVDKLFNYTGVAWEVLHNPISCPEPMKPRHKNEVCNFSFMGELSQRKGIIDLLNAFTIVSTINQNAHLYVAGNGDLPRLIKVVEDSTISGRVTFLGWINAEEKEKLLAKTDVIVLPSYAEGLPMSILEAMSEGLPVITTPVGSTTDAISDGKEGIIVRPGDIEAIAKAMCTLAENDELRKKMGNAAKNKFSLLFELEIVANRLLSIYQDLLEIPHAK
ncbi:glycosyltransferase family 4 protein [Photobacterium sagamiensis]|uniref:glycosyltransferase family 4 protein n=1 Tax=Photobacterium sagamiensis TaxID=2910241 RepID=UPI003D14AF57